jgi:signal peptidase I
MPNTSASTAIIGAVCVALFTVGLISVRSKPPKTLVLVRNAEGKVASILPSEYCVTQRKIKSANYGKKTAWSIEEPLKKRGKTKHVLALAALTAPFIGYALTAVMMGTYSPFMAVTSQSMQPALNYGDLIVLNGEQAKNIEPGDIIAFNVPSPYDRLVASPTVHRVTEKLVEDDDLYFKTRGDNNVNADTWMVPAENVVGKFVQFKIPYMGFIFIFLKTPLGLASFALVIAFVYVYDHYKKKERTKLDSRFVR